MITHKNNTMGIDTKAQCLHQLFEGQVELAPDAVALVFEQTKLTYGELNTRANRLAHYLIKNRTVKPDTLVGICVERSVEMVVGILAILKAGGAYVPLDPNYPPTRLGYMLQDANLSTVLTHNDIVARTPIAPTLAVCFDEPTIQTQPTDNPQPQQSGLTANHLAYVIYTSGSTGKPKGVLIEQHSVVSLVFDANFITLGPDNVIAQLSNMSFDAMTFELWGALLNGATLFYLSKEQLMKPGGLNKQVDTLFLTTALFHLMAQDNPKVFSQLKNVLFGGEACSRQAVQTIIQQGTPENLLHVYGPTENTTYSVWKLLTADYVNNTDKIALGKGMDDTLCYILDERQNPVSVGDEGELYLGGAGLARGYLNRPALTDESFIANPLPGKSDRLYKTGDLVRCLPHGEMTFVGRADHQLKIRGFRIEPGEIEHLLRSHDSVKHVVVMAKSFGQGDKRLVAYVVPHVVKVDGVDTASIEQVLVDYLNERLPDYMLPAAFVLLDKLPLTANGKVDRQALPEPDLSSHQQTYVPPRTELEQALCQLWQEVLGLEQVGINDNFLQLGGHSLLVMKMLTRASQQFALDLSINVLFEHPVLSEFSASISKLESGLVYPPIIAGQKEDIEASYAQQSLWMLDQIDGTSSHYNICTGFEISGELDLQALSKAFTRLVERHESLRTCFVQDAQGQLIQSIHQPMIVDLRFDESSLDDLHDIKKVEAGHRFDLSRDLMIRVRLVKWAPNSHTLLVTMHHIAADGWSMRILANEISALYQAYHQGQGDSLLPLAIQYADYAKWQRHWLQGDLLAAQTAYWVKQLADLPVIHALPLDKTRPAVQRYVGATHYCRLESSIIDSLQQLCLNAGATLFMGFHAAFCVLLARYSNETDIVVGSPTANREQAEVADLIGFFVNTLVLRSDLSDNPSFIDLLDQSKTLLLGAYAHQQVPFEQLVKTLQPQRSSSHSPLFQVMLVLQNNQQGLLELPGLKVSEAQPQDFTAKYDLTLNITEDEQGLLLGWEYNTDLFEPQTIKRMAQHFDTLLNAMVTAPTETVFASEMLNDAERQRLLVTLNDTASPYPKDQCIHQLFETQVEKNPDAVALVFEQQQMTYGELNIRANQLAHYLINVRNITPDTLVGICAQRSLEMVVGILAILKAGGAYVPLDPTHPPARLAYLFEDAGLSTVLMQKELLSCCGFTTEQAVCFDDAAIDKEPMANPKPMGLTSNHLAYVIYTSGSTGKPKGVLIEHMSVTNLAVNIDKLGLCDRVWGWFASTAFDASVQGLSQLAFGRQLHIISEGQKRDPLLLADSLNELSVIDCTPMMVQMWFASGLAAQLPNLVIGGEAISPQLWAELCQWQRKYNKKAVNVYGPTECTVDTHYTLISGEQPHLGKLMANGQAFVLNDSLSPTIEGVIGQLYLGGAGLARGYLNRPDLMAQQFISNPFHDPTDANSSARLYKTGDLVRWLPDGNLAFAGRIDHQVKIRGFRIELGEIEHTLGAYERVKDAVLVVSDSIDGDKRLVAYVVVQGEEQQTLAESLRQYLSQQLPDYMVPSAFVLLAQLPMTANGKIDHKALPALDLPLPHNDYVAPVSDMEKALCEIWQQVLGVERVGLNDNFFTLGGHSLLAMKLAAQVARRFNLKLAIKELFDHPVLKQFAARLLSLESGVVYPPITQRPTGQSVLTSYAQQSLWLVNQLDTGSAHYNMPVGFDIIGELDVDALNKTFATIVRRHESLRTCFVQNEDGVLLQVIRDDVTVDLSVEDLSALAPDEQTSRLSQTLKDEVDKVFDLSADLMTRGRLIKIAAHKHTLLVTLHHITSDGWSMAILINEISSLYRAYHKGLDNPLSPLPIQYADYAYWQRNWLQGEVLDKQMDYWRRQLADLPLVHSLGLDRPRPQRQRHVGKIIYSQVDATTSGALETQCRAHEATLFMGLHAAFTVLLSRYSNETDIVMGSSVANREQGEVADLIGYFVNTLVLRSDLSNNPCFGELLTQSKTLLLDAYAHQQVPFEQVVEALQPERSLSHSPLFQVMLVLQNTEQGVFELPGLASNEIELQSVIAKYDLTLGVSQTEQGLTLSWEFNTDLFDGRTIERFAAHFNSLLEAMLAAPQASVFAAQMLNETERHQLMVQYNDTAAPLPQDLCFHQLFEGQVEKTPDALAVMFEQQKLTYAQLNSKANQLAHYLVSQRGVKPDTLVGICAERSLDMIVGIVAILKAGGAYVPLDPQYPEARLAFVLEDANLSTILTQTEILARLPMLAAKAVSFTDPKISEHSTKNPLAAQLGLTTKHLAYVIYTSGSTGNPKGVMIEHLSLLNLALNINKLGLDDGGNAWGWFASYAFDASVKGLSQLAFGQPLHVISEQQKRDPDLLVHSLAQMSVIDCTPMMVEFWFSCGLAAQLPNLIIGGEAINEQLWRKLCEWQVQYGKKAVNVYGPTECTVDAHYCQIAGDQPNVGKLMSNVQAFVLNPSEHLAVHGVGGELHLGGAGLARGYLNQPELTAQKFMVNPFYDSHDPNSSKRLYKTGDLVRYLPGGELAFIGRIDHQVKIRGFRIELGEIENTLASYQGVKDVLLMAKNNAEGEARLIAYVVTGAERTHQNIVPHLRDYLSQRLPEHMVPSAFVLLEQFPLTGNGKVDRKALPEPDMAEREVAYVAPQSEVEKQLCEIWQAILAVEQVSTIDNFFHLGGHSLLATRMMSKVNSVFGVAVTLAEVFASPVVGAIGKLIEHRLANDMLSDNQRVFKLNDDEDDDMEEFDL